MSGQWAQLREAVEACSSPRVLDWVRAADEKQRRAAFPELVAHLRAAQDWRDWQRRAQARAVALAGCASTAKKAAVALNRGELRWTASAVDPASVVEVLRVRAVPWLGDLAQEMADRLPAEGGYWALVDALVRESGCAVPTAEGFVGGWVDVVRAAPDPDAALRGSPYTEVLLPMLFVHDRLGSRLEYTYGGHRGFLPALMRLSQDDAGLRRRLLEGCRARLLRGGRPGELRAYTRMHAELAPTAAEAAAGTADYLRLVETGNATVAGMAQRVLRGVDDAGLLAWDTLRDIAGVALNRPEKTLVKAQATWLRQVARRNTAQAAEIDALLAGSVEAVALPVAAPLPVPAPSPLGPPLDTVAQLAEELAALLAGDWSVPTVERVLAGIAHWRVRDQDALARAVRPLLDADRLGWWGRLAEQLREVLLTATVTGGRTDLWRQMADVFRSDTAVQGRPLRLLSGSGSGLHLVVAVRLAEMSVQLGRRPVPVLMATPTHANGRLEAEVLLRRLETAERDGWQPWSVDLDQALLRLPRDIDPQVARAAMRLRSPAGAVFARWVSGPMPDPLSLRREQTADPRPKHSWERQPAVRRVVALKPPEQVSPLMRDLMTVVRHDRPTMAAAAVDRPQLWVAALPSHREVVAASALPSLAALADLDHEGDGLLLAHLAEASGPVGPAVHLAVAYGLAARSAADRVAAVDGLLGLAATGDLDGAAVGREVGELAAAGVLKVNRVAAALGDAAAAGAVAAAWEISAAALPALVALPKARPGTGELMEVAGRCARAAGARAVPPEVAEFAARGGSGRLVAQARTLRDLVAA